MWGWSTVFTEMRDQDSGKGVGCLGLGGSRAGKTGVKDGARTNCNIYFLYRGWVWGEGGLM